PKVIRDVHSPSAVGVPKHFLKGGRIDLPEKRRDVKLKPPFGATTLASHDENIHRPTWLLLQSLTLHRRPGIRRTALTTRPANSPIFLVVTVRSLHSYLLSWHLAP